MDSEKTVGTILREARLAKRLSLADAEKGTSIRSRYLEALERDEYDKTPGEVFMKGMIRNYGNFLGLNGPELVQLYKAGAAGVAKEAVKSAGIREVDKVKLNIQLKDPRDVGSGTGRFELPHVNVRQCLAGVVVLLVLVGGYFGIPKAIDYFKHRPLTVASETQKVKQPAKPAVVWDKVQVELEATGDCWLEVQAEGKEIFAGILKAKDKKTFEAKEKLIVKYGNIGVVKVVFNGEPVDLQGQHGVQVKTYTLQGTQEEKKAIPPVKAEAQAKKAEPAYTKPAVKVEKAEPVTIKPAAKVEKAEPASIKPVAKTEPATTTPAEASAAKTKQ